jgi:hypothetical protein
MRWVKLHPTNISQKVQIIVEHFHANVAHLLEGKAKAMVLTDSRKAVVKYKKAIGSYIAKRAAKDGSYDYRTPIARLVRCGAVPGLPRPGGGSSIRCWLRSGSPGRPAHLRCAGVPRSGSPAPVAAPVAVLVGRPVEGPVGYAGRSNAGRAVGGAGATALPASRRTPTRKRGAAAATTP